MDIKPSRVQSPSSINTYKQCPRKYYFVYIQKLPTKQNIYTMRGTIVHSVLDKFYDMEFDTSLPSAGYQILMNSLSLFDKEWLSSKDKLESLGLEKTELGFYYEDSKNMMINWVSHFLVKLNTIYDGDFVSSFNKLKPISREERLSSENYSVMGFIDAIENFDNKIRVIDYKTSKADKLSDEYMLQLGIYALLYHEDKGEYPDEVGLFLLKHGERMVPVTEDLVKNAKFEIENVHYSTQTKSISDYPKKPGPLCNYCDFQNICFPNGR